MKHFIFLACNVVLVCPSFSKSMCLINFNFSKENHFFAHIHFNTYILVGFPFVSGLIESIVIITYLQEVMLRYSAVHGKPFNKNNHWLFLFQDKYQSYSINENRSFLQLISHWFFLSYFKEMEKDVKGLSSSLSYITDLLKVIHSLTVNTITGLHGQNISAWAESS